MCHHLRTGFELDSKSGVGQRLCYGAFDLEGLFFISQNRTSNQGMLSLVQHDTLFQQATQPTNPGEIRSQLSTLSLLSLTACFRASDCNHSE
jgi:hypothetical protein